MILQVDVLASVTVNIGVFSEKYHAYNFFPQYISS